jgi:hypothetical protein
MPAVMGIRQLTACVSHDSTQHFTMLYFIQFISNQHTLFHNILNSQISLSIFKVGLHPEVSSLKFRIYFDLNVSFAVIPAISKFKSRSYQITYYNIIFTLHSSLIGQIFFSAFFFFFLPSVLFRQVKDDVKK